MLNIDLMKEAAALGGYSITGTNQQDVANKARAQRRINIVKTDIISRFGGKWPGNYREGWLPLVALYVTGSATLTQNSNTVTGSGTAWTSDMKGRKFLGADNAYYKIASVTSTTVLILTQPYQGVTVSAQSYQIWQDEYRLYADVLSIGGFVDYQLPQRSIEASPGNMKESYPYPTSGGEPNIYTVIGKTPLTASYSTGTVTGLANTNVLTGVSTLWLANVEPGMQLTLGSYTYIVDKVNSDTELELRQLLVDSVVASTYSTIGKNCTLVRFKSPTTQRITHYWYYAKDVAFVNDNDEDWIAEQYPRVLTDGMLYFDYLDKNDVPRAMNSRTVFENSIKDMKVAVEEMYTGIRTLGIYVPPEARD